MKRSFRKILALILTCCTIAVSSSAAAVSVSAETEIVNDNTQTLTIPFDGSPIVLEKGNSYTFPTYYSKFFPGMSIEVTAGSKKAVKITNGMITANCAGKCTVKVTLTEGISFTKDINVKLPEVNIKFDTSKLTLGEGQTAKLRAILSAVGPKVKWTSSNHDVLTIGQDGTIKANRTGTAVVKASLNNGKTALCTIKVESAPKTITFTRGKLSLGLGESSKAYCRINGRSGVYSVTYTSSDPKVAEIDPVTGVITTHKTGKVVLKAKTYNGKVTTCALEVQKAPTSITLNKTEVVLKKGEATVLTAKLPNGTSSGSITYNVSNDQIIAVESNGLVKALKTGVAYVRVKTYNGKSALCKVSVK